MSSALLSTGIYSIPQAASLLGVNQQRLRGWVCGKSGAKGGPLIKGELPRAGRQIALSFVNLIEAKFIETFAQQGVSVLSIRYMAEEASRVLDHPHPFATNWIFKTDGKRIFMEAAERANDPCLYDLKGRNYAMHEVLSREFRKDIEFSASGLADAWFPRAEIAPHVRVTPKVAFGAPALSASGVPTEALADAFLAERQNAKLVSEWFEIPTSEVLEAVRFESELRTHH